MCIQYIYQLTGRYCTWREYVSIGATVCIFNIPISKTWVFAPFCTRCWQATRKDLHEQCRSLACHAKSSLDGTSHEWWIVVSSGIYPCWWLVRKFGWCTQYIYWGFFHSPRTGKFYWPTSIYARGFEHCSGEFGVWQLPSRYLSKAKDRRQPIVWRSIALFFWWMAMGKLTGLQIFSKSGYPKLPQTIGFRAIKIIAWMALAPPELGLVPLDPRKTPNYILSISS